MKLAEAVEEAKRWLAYLERQKEKSIAIQKLAAERRAGTCSDRDARRRLSIIDSNVTVYDGAKLAEAVKCLLRNTEEAMDAMEALDRLADEIDLAVDRARKAGLTDKEIAECLRDVAANVARGMP